MTDKHGRRLYVEFEIARVYQKGYAITAVYVINNDAWVDDGPTQQYCEREIEQEILSHLPNQWDIDLARRGVL